LYLLKMHRVVVTGMSMVTPLGSNLAQNWKNILSNKTAITKLPQKISGNCQVGGYLRPSYDWKQSSFKHPVYDLALELAQQAMDDAAIPAAKEGSNQFGCIIANQYGLQALPAPGKLRLILEMPHMVPAIVAIEHGIKGHISAPSAASAGSAQAIGDAYRLIKAGHL
jgi:3-oxoacyl-[acyl-carrier-protein] synthase II